MALDLSFQSSSEDLFGGSHQVEPPTSINNEAILQTPTDEQTRKFLRPHHSERAVAQSSQKKERPSLSLRKRKNGVRETSCKRALYPEQQQQQHQQQYTEQQQQQHQHQQPQIIGNIDNTFSSITDTMMGNIDSPSMTSENPMNSVVNVGSEGNLLDQLSGGFNNTFNNPACEHAHEASTTCFAKLANNVMKLTAYNVYHDKSARRESETSPISNHQCYIESAKFVENGSSTKPNVNIILNPTLKIVSRVFFNKNNKVKNVPVTESSETNTFYLSPEAAHEFFEVLYSKITKNDVTKSQLTFNDGMLLAITYSTSS